MITSVEPTAGSVLKDSTPLVDNDLLVVEVNEVDDDAEVVVWSEKSPQL